jgi:hypothetical protein
MVRLWSRDEAILSELDSRGRQRQHARGRCILFHLWVRRLKGAKTLIGFSSRVEF